MCIFISWCGEAIWTPRDGFKILSKTSKRGLGCIPYKHKLPHRSYSCKGFIHVVRTYILQNTHNYCNPQSPLSGGKSIPLYEHLLGMGGVSDVCKMTLLHKWCKYVIYFICIMMWLIETPRVPWCVQWHCGFSQMAMPSFLMSNYLHKTHISQ